MGTLLTSQELAERLNVSNGTVLRWKKQGLIPYVQPAGDKRGALVRYEYDAVLRALKRATKKKRREHPPQP
ncbi:MAG: helix-turn-helix domain-containing protein [Planctomycetota bacterium]